jgi:hypothetical protein
MQTQRHPQVFRGSPEWFVFRQIVRPPLRRIHGNHAPYQPHLGAALELFYPRLHIVDVEHGNALELLRERLTELGQPIIVNAEDLREQRAIRHTIEQ